MQISVKALRASSLGLPLPIDTNGVVYCIYNKGRLLRVYSSAAEVQDAIDIFESLYNQIQNDIQASRRK